MEFLVRKFPKRVGNVSVDEKFVKVDVPSKGLLFKSNTFENIPIKNISNAKINQKTNTISLIFGWALLVLMGGAGIFYEASNLFMNSSKVSRTFGGAIPLFILAFLGYLLMINAKRVVITIEKSGLKTIISASSSETNKLKEIYELIFEGIQKNI